MLGQRVVPRNRRTNLNIVNEQGVRAILVVDPLYVKAVIAVEETSTLAGATSIAGAR